MLKIEKRKTELRKEKPTKKKEHYYKKGKGVNNVSNSDSNP